MRRRLVATALALAAISGGIAFFFVHREGAKQRELADAARVCRERAEWGDANAQFRFGWMCYYGRGVRRDQAEAARWYRRASDQNHAKAQSALAEMYSEGRGVRLDYTEAFRL